MHVFLVTYSTCRSKCKFINNITHLIQEYKLNVQLLPIVNGRDLMFYQLTFYQAIVNFLSQQYQNLFIELYQFISIYLSNLNTMCLFFLQNHYKGGPSSNCEGLVIGKVLPYRSPNSNGITIKLLFQKDFSPIWNQNFILKIYESVNKCVVWIIPKVVEDRFFYLVYLQRLFSLYGM